MATAESKRQYSSDPTTRAKELVAEGKLGGKRKGAGRPKGTTTKPQPRRASTVIAEVARENGDKIAGVLVDALLDPDASKADRMRAIKMLVGTEDRETDRERDEASDPSRAAVTAADGEEAKAKLARMLNDPVTGSRLRAVLASALPQTTE